MPTVKNVGEPCAGEPHARFEVAAGGNRGQPATPARPWRLPPTLQKRLREGRIGPVGGIRSIFGFWALLLPPEKRGR